MYLQNNTTLQGGKYKIVRHISSGGFGNTYEGIHTMLDTRVAIKEFFVKDHCNRDENTSQVSIATQSKRELVEKLRKKFNDEAKSVFMMKHENIVRVIDVFEENSTAYYVMDYIEGTSLHEIMKQRGPLSEAEAVGYIRQIADALKYVHSLNRLHLDIKPGNIMVDASGRALLIDFGASKHYDDETGENTSTLLGVNTVGYAPVEQSTQSFTSFSPATDIYALGATLYKLLTGITPPDAALLMAEEAELAPLPLTISPAVRNTVMKAMEVRRKNRLQSIDEFHALLVAAPKVESKKEEPKKVVEEDDERTIFSEEPTTKTSSTYSQVYGYKETPYMVEEQQVSAQPSSNSNSSSKVKVTEVKEETSSVNWGILIFVAIVIITFFIWLVGNIDNSSTVKQIQTTTRTTQQTQSVQQNNDKETVSNKSITYNGKTFIYTGILINGLPEGMGVGRYDYGFYNGVYKNGMREGEGKFETKDGDVYEGTFKADKYDTGTITLKDGSHFTGKFNQGQPYNGSWYDKNNSLICNVKNGVEQ